MKKILTVILILLAVSAVALRAVSPESDSGAVTVEMQTGNPLICVNGSFVRIDESGTCPVIIEGRTLLPVRAVIEALGGKILWDENEKSVSVLYKENELKLFIDSEKSFLNGKEKESDVCPKIIGNRTMMPIRFIAENLGFDVSWNESSKTVTIKNRVSDQTDGAFSFDCLPSYTGEPYNEINGGMPFFSSFDMIRGDFEEYSELDSLGRCGPAFANISEDLMPTEKRGSIGMIKPSGWHTIRYDGIDQMYLYNRCHLIAYQLSGENDNEKNLITGTRYMNTEGMLPFENKVANYVRKTGNHVLYRATPVFEYDNLLAKGVILEAYSVEDSGLGICFNVFCHNVQPGIELNYKTGESSQIIERTIPDIPSAVTYIANKNTKKFHRPDCESVSDMKEKNKEVLYCTREEAIAKGYSPCGRCMP